MKKINPLLLTMVLSLGIFVLFKLHAADPTTFQVVEFATIRWQGRENSQLIRPNGRIEPLRSLFERTPRPDGIDERVFYMNRAMNALAKEGYDFASMNNDEIVMRRHIERQIN